MVDKRFKRLASVGLIVRAPKPEAWCGITEILLVEEGVFVPGPDFVGVRVAFVDEDLVWSGVREGVPG